MYLKSCAITTDTVFFAPPAVASFSFLPAPRAHNAPIYFHFYRLKSTNISFWGCDVLRIVLFIRGMWSHVVLLFVAARSSRGTAAVASSGRSTRRKRRRGRCTSTSGIKSSTSTCISTSTKNGGGSSTTTKCSNGSTGGRSSVAHAGATAPGLIRCTNPHTAAVICTTASTQHPPPGGVRGKAQSARRLLVGPRWAPSPGSPNNQQPARVTQPAQPRGLAVPLRPNTCSAEGIGPRKGKGRAEEAPSLLPRLDASFGGWWLVGSSRPEILS